jgi:tetratricopeptide (TPR) repeat protein
MNLRFKIKDFHLSSVNRKQAWLFYLVIGLSVTIVYLPTFRGEFILDDNPLIKNNPYIKGEHSISSYLTQEDGIVDRTQIGSNYHTGYYRPLINLTYWIDHRIWGMNAPGFRTTNLILHLLSCFLLYHLILLFVNDQRAAFLATLLFSLHPVHTESVAWITSRNNILVTLFSLLCFYFYLKGKENGSYLKIWVSGFCFMLATLSKEFALMLLPIMLLHQWLFDEEKGNIRKTLYTYLPFVLVLIIYFLLRHSATGSLLSPSKTGDVWTKIYYAPYLIVYNLRCVFFPYRLHSFAIGYPASLLGWKAIGSIFALVVAGIMLWKKRDDKWILFSCLCFLISLFPVLNIIPTSASSLVGMRWLYFPMSFLTMALAWTVLKVLSKSRFAALSLVSIAVVYFGLYTYTLNRGLWQNEKKFFRVEVLGFNNPLYYSGLAELYLDEKRYEDAERYFRESLKYYPHTAGTYINYSALFIDTERPEAALSLLRQAKSLTMTHDERGEWFNNMGMAQFKLKDREEALKDFLKAVMYCPDQALFWGNLGGAYGAMGDYRNSISSLKKGLEIAPDAVELRKNLALTYMKMKNYESAIETLEKISAPERRSNEEIAALLREARHKLLTKGN